MDSFIRAFADAGHRFWPITNLVQIALLLVAAGMFAVGTPDRGGRVAQHVGAAVHDVAALLDRLPVLLLELIGVLPAQDGMTFITERETWSTVPKVAPSTVSLAAVAGSVARRWKVERTLHQL